MECLEFRRMAGGDPNCGEPGFVAHAAQCDSCAGYLRELTAFDALLLRALRIDVPPAAATAGRPASHRARWLGLAASLVLALGIGSGIWLSYPTDTLAADVVAHVRHEPNALVPGRQPVDPGLLLDVMDRSGSRLAEGIGEVTYARTCLFRGKLVPHLVVQGELEPVTVLVLPDERVETSMPFHEGDYRGRIVPIGDGSVAIVGQSDASIEQVETRFLAAVQDAR